MEKKPRSKPATSSAAFLLTVAGQVFFLSKSLGGGLASLPPVLYGEILSCILIVAAAIFTATSKGWRSKTAMYVAVGAYLIFVAFNLYQFSFFKDFYLSKIVTEYPSYGAAIEAMKLILPLIGIVAAIPVMPGPTGREYADALNNVGRRQQIERAQSGARQAEADLKRTIESLRDSMPPEQLAVLIEELKSNPARRPEKDAGPADTPEGGTESEEWKGWGCG